MNSHRTASVRHLLGCAFLGLPLLFLSACGDKPAPAADPSRLDLSKGSDLFASPIPPAETGRSPTSVVARVNRRDITHQQVQQEIAVILSTFRGQMPPERLAQMRPQILQRAMDSAVAKALLLDAVEAEKVTVSDEEIQQTLDKLVQARNTTLETFLAETRVREEDLRRNIGLDLSISKLLESKLGKPVPAGADEIKVFYEKNTAQFLQPETVTARHILMATKSGDTDAQRREKQARAEDLRRQLLAGADFETLARAQSDGPSASRGGSVGKFPRGRMPPAFDEAAFRQKVGDIGEIVETPFGFHIIQVQAHDESRQATLDEVADQVGGYLGQQKWQAALQDYVNTLKQTATINLTDQAPAPAPAPATVPAVPPAAP